MNNGKQTSINDLREEMRVSNRLMILLLVRAGVQQRDIAATLGISKSGVSQMFPSGLLRRVATLSKSAVEG